MNPVRRLVQSGRIGADKLVQWRVVKRGRQLAVVLPHVAGEAYLKPERCSIGKG